MSCPKCGAERRVLDGTLSAGWVESGLAPHKKRPILHEYLCLSWVDDLGKFHQCDGCRIAELEKRAGIAEEGLLMWQNAAIETTAKLDQLTANISSLAGDWGSSMPAGEDDDEHACATFAACATLLRHVLSQSLKVGTP